MFQPFLLPAAIALKRFALGGKFRSVASLVTALRRCFSVPHAGRGVGEGVGGVPGDEAGGAAPLYRLLQRPHLRLRALRPGRQVRGWSSWLWHAAWAHGCI